MTCGCDLAAHEPPRPQRDCDGPLVVQIAIPSVILATAVHMQLAQKQCLVQHQIVDVFHLKHTRVNTKTPRRRHRPSPPIACAHLSHLPPSTWQAVQHLFIQRRREVLVVAAQTQGVQSNRSVDFRLRQPVVNILSTVLRDLEPCGEDGSEAKHDGRQLRGGESACKLATSLGGA